MTFARTWSARFGFNWTTRAVPVVPMLLLGSALGPAGLAMLTPRVLDVIDPVLPVAVATLGVLAGLELTRPVVLRNRSLLAKANLQAVVTGMVITVGFWWVEPSLLGQEAGNGWLVALAVGVMGATSALLPAADEDDSPLPAASIRDLDAPLPILVGTLVLTAVQTDSWSASLLLAAQSAGLALVVSGIAWLVLTSSSQGAEQRVFAIAILLVLGGLSDYLSISSLGVGLLAGIACGVMGGATRDSIERDASYLRHPLVVLMLLWAGARLVVTWPIVASALTYLLLRTTGKLAGWWFVNRTSEASMPSTLGTSLLAPGVLGVAFAVNSAPMFGAIELTLLATAILGTMGSQLVAGSWSLGEREP